MGTRPGDLTDIDNQYWCRRCNRRHGLLSFEGHPEALVGGSNLMTDKEAKRVVERECAEDERKRRDALARFIQQQRGLEPTKSQNTEVIERLERIEKWVKVIERLVEIETNFDPHLGAFIRGRPALSTLSYEARNIIDELDTNKEDKK